MAATKVRRRRRVTVQVADAYGVREGAVETFSTGCTVLDLALGGGWAYGRIANVVGDRSTGKTLLAIEAAANFARANPGGKVVYYEAEAAFDRAYAERLGLPRDRIEFPEVTTVEELHRDLEARVDAGGKTRKYRTLVVVDSLDALSDQDEVGRAVGESSYGASKAKAISKLFRQLVRKLEQRQVTTIIVSQVRDAIGVTFGERLRRSGGHALDFYATHALWLMNCGQIKRKVDGVERTTGVAIKGRVKKCKIGPPFRTAEFPIVFDYGVEDLAACLGYLVEVRRTKAAGWTAEEAKKLAAKVDRLDAARYAEELRIAREAVRKVWAELDEKFAPKRRKYEDVG